MTIKKPDKQIRCRYCYFAKKEKSMSNRFWTAYECSNSESPYYKSLLNVDPQGNKLGKITWSGCLFGERSLAK